MHPFRLLSRLYRSRPLASSIFTPRASANDALALVYASRLLPHPDTFTQAPTYCFYFCDDFSDIALLDRHFFQNQMKKRSVARVHLTCNPRQGLPSPLPPVVQVSSGSLAAALAMLLRSMSSLHWRSPAALSIAGI